MLLNSFMLLLITLLKVILLTSVSFVNGDDDNIDFETFLDLPPINENGRNAITNPMLRWPNGIIPYELSNNLTVIEKDIIINAISIFNDKTCIQLIPKQKRHVDWLRYEKSKGCGTGVGYWKGRTRPHKLILNNECLKLPVAIQHETMHVMGIFHEQCRYDRDNYIDILWNNIPKSQYKNFVKVSQMIADPYDIGYDYESLMHYKPNSFAKKKNTITMKPKKEKDENGKTIILGYVGGPTEKDFLKLNRMYNCTNFLKTELNQTDNCD